MNPTNIFATDKGPVSLAMSPTAPFLFVANQTAGNITAYTVDPGTGSLVAIQASPVRRVSPFPIAPASHPSSVAISPKGDFLYVANATEGTIAVFNINGKGVLAAAGSPVSVGTGATPTSIAVEHSGRFLYVTDSAHNAVRDSPFRPVERFLLSMARLLPPARRRSGWALIRRERFCMLPTEDPTMFPPIAIDASSGALGPVNGSPFPTGGVGPSAVAVDADHFFCVCD